ncbi:MAG TPA: hypothetical protein VK116_13740 [Planctomycetota bacterium]|nr:hypothetical protein [Planctomycetota bacterium]
MSPPSVSLPYRASLFLLAHGRSGDKGDLVNIGVIARRADWYELLVRELTIERVARHLSPLGIGRVERFELANLGALNFLVHDALGGGGAVTLRLDAQGKTYANALFRMEIDLEEDRRHEVIEHWGGSIPAWLRLEPRTPGAEGAPGDSASRASDERKERR